MSSSINIIFDIRNTNYFNRNIISGKVNKYLRLFRFGNGVMGILGVVIGAFIAIGFDIQNYIPELIAACFVVIAFIAGGNSLNDYIDREIDLIGHPDRPIPMKEIAPRTALYLGISGLSIAVIISFFLGNLETTATVLIAALLMIGYETVLKQRGFIGNLTIAILTGMVFLFGASVVNHIESNYIIAAMAMLVSVGREIAKDVEDVASDKGERKTLPMSIGVKNASIIASIFFIAGPVLSIWPILDNTFGWMYCIVFVADAIFIYVSMIVFKDAHKAEKLAKIAMMIALVAFILGVIQ